LGVRGCHGLGVLVRINHDKCCVVVGHSVVEVVSSPCAWRLP
jgi:hypothetical protein